MRALSIFFTVGILLISALPGHAVEVTLQHDSFAGGIAGFQGGFVAGELGATRFVTPGGTQHQLKKVQVLFGGAGGSQSVTLNIYEDPAGNAAPSTLIYTGDYLLTGDDTVLNEIDLSLDNVFVTGGFRVAFQFQHSGAPSIARDDDGNINATQNFIWAQGIGWVQSNLLGITGDWIIRAVVEDQAAGSFTVGGSVSGLSGTLILQNNGGDDLVLTSNGPFQFSTPLANAAAYDVTVFSEPAGQDCILSNGAGTISNANVSNVSINCTNSPGSPLVLQNDGFTTGANAAFQLGFVSGEIAAVRLIPAGPTDVTAVRFLYGGATTTRTIRLQLWDDALQADPPGTLLYAADYQVTGSDAGIQEIDLSATPVAVTGPFRVGIQFYDAGAPSVARDDDGNITANRNFISASGVGWVEASSVGVLGDWVIRAVVTGAPVSNDEPTILSMVDVGNDQGKQIRIQFAASAQDDIGSGEPVVSYEAFRRIQPGLKMSPLSGKRLDGWEFVGSIPSHGEATYSMVAPTLADSTIVDGMHWSTFFIRAATASPFTFYDSPPDSGYSLDNLAPALPQNLALGGGLLSWDPVGDSDVSYYRVYGSSSGERDGSESLLGASTLAQFSVASTPHAYYLVTANDFAGNEGQAASTATATAVGPTPRAPLALDVAPNPFNPATVIQFELQREMRVSLRVFDARGRLVETLISNERRAAGEHRVDFRGDLASGVYHLQLIAGNRVEKQKMTILR